MIEVRRYQYPVGQGGFHSAEIHFGKARFRYVYDCGSTHRAALEREITAFEEGLGSSAPLEMLALSHLDDDHVNGVEGILSHRDIETIVIPYLHPFERLMLVAQACARGTLTESRFDLIENPEAWFLSRGARRVVHVLPTTDGIEGGDTPRVPPEGPDSRSPPKPSERETLEAEGWVELPEQLRSAYPDLVGAKGPATVLLPGHRLTVRSGQQRSAVWMLVPFTHPEPERLQLFLVALKSEMGLSPPRLGKARGYFRRLRNILKSKPKRVELGRLYKKIRSDRNLSSMSVYSGPAFRYSRANLVVEERYWRGPRFHKVELPPGWLGTGDAVLTRQERVVAFERFFTPLFPHVGVFMLPHHGSRHNFSGDLLADHLREVVWVAAYGRKNRYGHPSPRLLRALSRRGSSAVARVTEHQGSMMEEWLLLE